jgi:hypothetical protein
MGEKFQAGSGNSLVIIFLGMRINIDKLRHAPQLYRCITGLFIAFISLFYPSKTNIDIFLAISICSYVLLLMILAIRL